VLEQPFGRFLEVKREAEEYQDNLGAELGDTAAHTMLPYRSPIRRRGRSSDRVTYFVRR
jgi:hypothetical protein